MPLRSPVLKQAAIALGLALALPHGVAWASEPYRGGWHDGRWHADDAPSRPYDYRDALRSAEVIRQDYRDDRHPGQDEWLADCRRRVAGRDRGVGGAVLGGVVGGVAGNRIAGRGNRAVGTLAGAAVGAVAGSAIDRAEDNGRVRDECEAYLDDYYARYDAGYRGYGYPQAQPGYYYGYAPGYGYAGTVPTAVPYGYARREPGCTETVEYVYEDVPVTRPTRRAKVMADKRVRVGSGKRLGMR